MPPRTIFSDWSRFFDATCPLTDALSESSSVTRWLRARLNHNFWYDPLARAVAWSTASAAGVSMSSEPADRATKNELTPPPPTSSSRFPCRLAVATFACLSVTDENRSISSLKVRQS